MSIRPSRLMRISIACASCLWLAACAGPGLFSGGSDAPPFSNTTLSMQSASDSITIGKSSKSDVMTALGAALVINFDSGYEVWVYRAKSRGPAESKAELAILFSPNGVVKKTRLRPGYAVRN